MAKTARDARRHIREWSNFFAGVQKITESEINSFLENHKRKVLLKQSLKRLKARGFLLDKGDHLIPTKKGLIFFRKQNLLVRYKNSSQKWDGKWRLISFDVPVNEDIKRSRLRGLLKEFDFYQLHKSVWVSPYKLAEEFWKLLFDQELDKYCKMMTVEIIEGGEEMKNYFHLD